MMPQASQQTDENYKGEGERLSQRLELIITN
jgi:hypothetical protein